MTDGKTMTVGHHFAIVDSDNKSGYPANFICLLPQLGKNVNEKSMFSRLFGEQSTVKAEQMLSEALLKESDNIVKAEIMKRLSLLSKSVITF